MRKFDRQFFNPADDGVSILELRTLYSHKARILTNESACYIDTLL